MNASTEIENAVRAFTVPGTPIGKARARVVQDQRGRSHSYTPEKTALYEKLVHDCYVFQHPGKPALAGPVAIRVTAYMPIPKSWPRSKKGAALAELIKPTVKPDASNILKGIEDGLNGAAYEDDKQIVYATIEKKYGADPRAEVELWNLPETEEVRQNDDAV